jgi:hypothetical protein
MPGVEESCLDGKEESCLDGKPRLRGFSRVGLSPKAEADPRETP